MIEEMESVYEEARCRAEVGKPNSEYFVESFSDLLNVWSLVFGKCESLKIMFGISFCKDLSQLI